MLGCPYVFLMNLANLHYFQTFKRHLKNSILLLDNKRFT